MNPFAPFKPMVMQFGRELVFACIFVSGGFAAYASQDRVPDPRAWFWSLLWVLCFHLIIAALYFRRVRHWTRWAAACIAAATLISFGVMSWRVWV
jgi:hypothetical protein